jgi:hypothetical protein
MKPNTAEIIQDGDTQIITINLVGTPIEMGRAYGRELSEQLNAVLKIILGYFVDEKQIDYQAVLDCANKFYARYSIETYREFLQGMSEGSGLSLDDCKIILAMETLNALLAQPSVAQCAFLSLPPEKTETGSVMIGRNYDYPPPFDKCAKFLVVAVYHFEGKVPTATVSLPGQIFCATGINAANIFLEFNNGMPSGGYEVAEKQTLLIKLLDILTSSSSLAEVKAKLRETETDFSLIVNYADPAEVKACEFSSTLGARTHSPEMDKPHASTNFFLGSWQEDAVPAATDESAWEGVTRRNNLLALAEAQAVLTMDDLKVAMETPLAEGGAHWPLTIYQVLYDAGSSTMHLRSCHQKAWTPIPLASHFNSSSSQEVEGKDSPSRSGSPSLLFRAVAEGEGGLTEETLGQTGGM